MIIIKLIFIFSIFIFVQMNFIFAKDKNVSNSDFLVNVYNLDNLTSSEVSANKELYSIKYLSSGYNINHILKSVNKRGNNSTSYCTKNSKWETFKGVNKKNYLLKKVNKTSTTNRKREYRDLKLIEDCFRKESKIFNELWTEHHRDLVTKINDIKEIKNKTERLINEKTQIKNSINIQKQSIASLRLIYQSKLMEIPTAFLIVGKARREYDISKEDLGRRLQSKSQEFVKLKYSDHQIKSETEVENLKIIKDFISSFQGGVVRSFEFDPLPFLDKNRDLYYLQAYRLYPLFSEQQQKSGSIDMNVVENDELEKLEKYIFELSNDSAHRIPERFLNDFKDEINKRYTKVVQSNRKNIKIIKGLEETYIKEISAKELKLDQLKVQLDAIVIKLNDYPSIDLISKVENDFKNKLNDHVKSRTLIVVTNSSELVQGTTTVIEQYIEIASEAYETLINRAKSLKSFKFFIVENGELVEASAGNYYKAVTPVEWSIPFYRNTYRDEEYGNERIGMVLALKVQFGNLNRAGEIELPELKIPKSKKLELPEYIPPVTVVKPKKIYPISKSKPSNFIKKVEIQSKQKQAPFEYFITKIEVNYKNAEDECLSKGSNWVLSKESDLKDMSKYLNLVDGCYWIKNNRNNVYGYIYDLYDGVWDERMKTDINKTKCRYICTKN